ncbi:MAG: hypothetical protein IIA14_14720 [SAR324 cluster bacterium]|nr:hypothetical protein [SAR324 cluster bacterium]
MTNGGWVSGTINATTELLRFLMFPLRLGAVSLGAILTGAVFETVANWQLFLRAPTDFQGPLDLIVSIAIGGLVVAGASLVLPPFVRRWRNKLKIPAKIYGRLLPSERALILAIARLARRSVFLNSDNEDVISLVEIGALKKSSISAESRDNFSVDERLWVYVRREENLPLDKEDRLELLAAKHAKKIYEDNPDLRDLKGISDSPPAKRKISEGVFGDYEITLRMFFKSIHDENITLDWGEDNSLLSKLLLKQNNVLGISDDWDDALSSRLNRVLLDLISKGYFQFTTRNEKGQGVIMTVQLDEAGNRVDVIDRILDDEEF